MMHQVKKKESSIPIFYRGFDTSKLSEFKDTTEIREIDLLSEIIRLYNNNNMKKAKIGRRRFVWIHYGLLLEKFFWSHYTMKMLKTDLNKLERNGFIDRQVKVYEDGKKVFFYITAQTRDIYNFNVM